VAATGFVDASHPLPCSIVIHSLCEENKSTCDRGFPGRRVLHISDMLLCMIDLPCRSTRTASAATFLSWQRRRRSVSNPHQEAAILLFQTPAWKFKIWVVFWLPDVLQPSASRERAMLSAREGGKEAPSENSKKDYAHPIVRLVLCAGGGVHPGLIAVRLLRCI
jgi:hypothetical protein